MKTPLRIALLSAAVLATGCAQIKDPLAITLPAHAAASPGWLTRAEVLADLQMWQLAGMHDYARREEQSFTDDRYRAALAKYQALRASPAFDELAGRIAQNPHAVAVLR